MSSSGGFFDVAAGREELTRIENQASSQDFWNDQEAAQKLLQKRTILEKKIQRQEHFESQIADAGVLFEFAEEDDDSLKELRAMVERLEHEIDAVSERFDPPTEFVVPGETKVAALLDVARTVARRAERHALVAAPAPSLVVTYLNRLSDLLWTLARWQEGHSLPSRH